VIPAWEAAGESAMMGRQDRDQRQLFYEFSLDEMIPPDHLLRRINVFATAVLADLHNQLKAFYSDIGRPSVDPELMIRMLLVGYCYGIRHERRLCQEVALHLAYRWFCKLDLDDKVPNILGLRQQPLCIDGIGTGKSRSAVIGALAITPNYCRLSQTESANSRHEYCQQAHQITPSKYKFV
jgi:transposase